MNSTRQYFSFYGVFPKQIQLVLQTQSEFKSLDFCCICSDFLIIIKNINSYTVYFKICHAFQVRTASKWYISACPLEDRHDQYQQYTNEPKHYDHMTNMLFVLCVLPTQRRPTRHMDSSRLKVSCGIWHKDVASRSFKSCRL